VYLKKDYHELAILNIILLGGNLPATQQYSRHAPWSIAHARWMSKVIYTFKITLFKVQLHELHVIDDSALKEEQSLAIFYLMYDVTALLQCTNPESAPVNDLRLYQSLLNNISLMKNKSHNFPVNFQSLAEACLHKLDNHLWYLSERLCVLCLFSSEVNVAERKILCKLC